MTSEPGLFGDDAFARVADAVAQPAASYDPVLFGHDATERIVAAEILGNALRVWRRDAGGHVLKEDRHVSPWLLVAERAAAPPGSELVELEGPGLRWLCLLRDWREYRSTRMNLRDQHAEYLAYAGSTRTALTISGITLFKGMSLQDVHRMQIDIETDGLDPEGANNRILLIAVSDNRGCRCALEGEEPDLLRELNHLVVQLDPDIIEGHNIHGFDLPFIAARCRRHGIAPALGRDGMAMVSLPRRTFSIGGITRPLEPWHIPGRHVIDTLLAVQRFDWAKGSLTSYGLKPVARALGISAEDRVELPRDQMAQLYRTDRARVVTYALQDVQETAALAEMVTATEFYQTQMVPDAYGLSAVSGAGEKINAIFIRAYLAGQHAIPLPSPTRSYEGGHTALLRSGVIHHVVKADVESLYPSIMLTSKIRPSTDRLGIFLPMLAELTRRRLEAKSLARAASGQAERYWDGLQNSFKVLINSFYGYLGAGGFNFNDPDAAAEVTRIGRVIVKDIAQRMEASGSSIIEIDTDGVYFVPPSGIDDEPAERSYIAEIDRGLPEGIRLAFDGRYRTMLSVKTKNYVLLDYGGKRTFKGASLRSRADEPYGRAFLVEAVDLMLAGKTAEIRTLYLDTAARLRQRQVPIERLARRERITEKTFTSEAKARQASVAAGAQVGDYLDVYERSNGQLERVENYVPGDENVAYYVDKLYKFASRLRDAIGDGFDRLIPRPSNGIIVEAATLDLFGDEA